MTADRFLDIHHLTREQLAVLDPAITASGVVLGTGQQQERIPVQMFRGTPTRVALVTAPYVAHLFAFRALGAGARIEVVSARPQAWKPVMDLPGGRAGYAQPGQPRAAGSAGLPVLICDEPGPGGIADRSEIGPWQSVLTVHDFLTLQAVPALRSYDLVVLQRVNVETVQPLRTTFGLTEDFAELLPQMPDDTIALLTPGQGLLANLSPTAIELGLFGAPTRVPA